jgi:putative adenylate-forming enzyme
MTVPPTGAAIGFETFDVPRILARRRELDRRARGSRRELMEAQARSLASLRASARDRSAFYRRFHSGLDDEPLERLPVLTKQTLVERWDEVATDPALRLDRVRAFAAGLGEEPQLFLGRFVVLMTSGSSGMPVVIVRDLDEWRTILAWYMRARDARPQRSRGDRRIAFIGANVPTHTSAILGASLRTASSATLTLQVTSPIAEIVGELNAFRPSRLVLHARMAHLLALEQRSGRLRIAPDAVFCSAEVLEPEARRAIRETFGVEPVDTYATTETGPLASQCRRGRLHLQEDLVLVENLDDEGRAVPEGAIGERLVATVLFARTLPLIRYEISDLVRISPADCDCGLPFRVVESIDGRVQDILTLRGAGTEEVRVHPVVFNYVMSGTDVRGWQVVRLGLGVVRLDVVPGPADVDLATVGARAAEMLHRTGARVRVEVECVDHLYRTPTGKTPLVLADPPAEVRRAVGTMGRPEPGEPPGSVP